MKASTGLFIGAGFSFEAGMPLIWEVTAELKTWLSGAKLKELNNSWRAQGGGHPESILSDFLMVLERSDLHYEAVLGYLMTQARRPNLRQSSNEYYYLYSWFVQMVYYVLYSRQISNFAFLQANLPFYDGIKSLCSENNTLRIFSLNHDVIVEAIAARLGINVYTGFSRETTTLPVRDRNGKVRGEIKAALLTKDTLENGAMYFPNPQEPGIYLFKLHGALDIFAFNDGKDLLKLLPEREDVAGVLRVLWEANENLFYPAPGLPRGRAHASNEIAYADKQGEMQFLRRSILAGAYKFDERQHQTLPLSIMKHFEANLNFVTNLVCIGYSFGDLHINHVIRRWLEFFEIRTLEIVSPVADGVPQFLLHLAPQIKVIRQTATNFLDERANIIRPLRQRTEKKLRDLLRSVRRDSNTRNNSAPESVRQMQVFAEIIALFETRPDIFNKPEEDPFILAEKWTNESGLTQGMLLYRLHQHLQNAITRK